MKIIQDRLHHVASKDAARPAIAAPFPFTWRDAAWEGVTNGHCLLAWPAQFDIAPVENSPNMATLLDRPHSNAIFPAKGTTLDALRAWCADWVPVECPACAGKGETETVVGCETCDGTGTHNCGKCDADHDCGHCNGSGEHKDDVSCPNCNGKRIDNGDHKPALGNIAPGVVVNRRVLARALLPLDGDADVTVASADRYEAVRVDGPGFVAMVMPIRADETRNVFDGWK